MILASNGLYKRKGYINGMLELCDVFDEPWYKCFVSVKGSFHFTVDLSISSPQIVFELRICIKISVGNLKIKRSLLFWL